MKRREVLGRFAALVRCHLDEAVAEGSIPPVDTDVAAYAWLGALNEVVMQSLEGELPSRTRRPRCQRSCFVRSARRTSAPPPGAERPPDPRAQLSTYPPSSTGGDPPRLARALVTGGPRSRDRSMLAKARLPIGR
jgi:hypothetical protein